MLTKTIGITAKNYKVSMTSPLKFFEDDDVTLIFKITEVDVQIVGENGESVEIERDVFPENPMLAQSYVPWHYMDKTFKPNVGLKMGTIFPELVSPYMPCQSMRVNEYLEATNKIGKGCNKC